MSSFDSTQKSLLTGQTADESQSSGSQATEEIRKNRVVTRLNPYIRDWQNAYAEWQLRKGNANSQAQPELDSWLNEKRALVECGVQFEQVVKTMAKRSDQAGPQDWTDFQVHLASADTELKDQGRLLNGGVEDLTPRMRIYNATEGLKKSMISLYPDLIHVWEATTSDAETIRSGDTYT
jgi:hypothetical protein